MNDLISRSEVWKAFISRVDSICDLEDVREILDSIPTTEPKVGRWIEHPNHIECPNCKVWFLKKYMPRNSYCPNCGAKMERSE